MNDNWLQATLRGRWERTTNRHGKTHMTCWCPGYDFPHRLGGGECDYNEDQAYCGSCDSGFCEYHGMHEHILYEGLSAAYRNPNLTRR